MSIFHVSTDCIVKGKDDNIFMDMRLSPIKAWEEQGQTWVSTHHPFEKNKEQTIKKQNLQLRTQNLSEFRHKPRAKHMYISACYTDRSDLLVGGASHGM